MDYTELARLLTHHDFSTRRNFITHMRHIERICTIACNVKLNIDLIEDGAQIRFELSIEAKHIKVEDYEGGLENYNLENYKYFSKIYICKRNVTSITRLLGVIANEISSLTYSNVTCLMTTIPDTLDVLKKKLQILFECQNCETKQMENCGVCLEETERLTDCGHYLCIPCADKMCRGKQMEDGVPCPICRGSTINTYCHENEFSIMYYDRL